MTDQIIKPIDVMSDDELISIITIKKANFNENFREKVLSELNNRGIILDDILNIAKYKINSENFANIKVDSAFEKLALLNNSLDVIYFQNYMAEHICIQKNNNFFVLHHFNPESGFNSFFLDDNEMLKNSLQEFLSLDNWLPEGVEIIKHWDTFTESSSSAYILRLAKMLDEIDLYYSINSPQLVRFSSFSKPYSIVLPVEDIEEAEEVMKQLDDLKNSFDKKFESAENNKDLDKQLEILMELESITPEDSVLFYNKAQLLDEKGDYQNASDALIDSFNIDFENGEIEDIEDIENYLIEILDKVDTKTNTLHCLATISAYKNDNDKALKFYEKLLELDENDPIAHLNLGHIYYSHLEDDEKVKFHFNKYIELETNVDAIEPIKAILKNLK